MKIYIAIVLFFLCPFLFMHAQSLDKLFVKAPQTLTPYLTEKMRNEMVEMKKLGVSGDVLNLLNGTSILDTITSDYLKVELSKAKILEMKRLPVEGSDSVTCVVTTFLTPEAQSEIAFYDTDWNKLPTEQYFIGPYSIRELMHKPDSITDERFAELTKIIEFDMIGISMSIDSCELTISPSLPLTSKEDRKELKDILSQQTLIWNGSSFK